MPKVRIDAQRRTWETPMANRVTDIAVALREAMEELGWTFTRERGEKAYSRFAIVLPMLKVAYVFRFRVSAPLQDVTFDTWEVRMTHRGDISYLRVDGYTYEQIREVQQLLDELVERLPRLPWDFPLGQRMEAGLVIPEWNKAKKMWRYMRYDVTKRTPKDWVPKGSLGDRARVLHGEDPDDE